MERRGFLLGLGAALIAAPAVVRAESLMKVMVLRESVAPEFYIEPILTETEGYWLRLRGPLVYDVRWFGAMPNALTIGMQYLERHGGGTLHVGGNR